MTAHVFDLVFRFGLLPVFLFFASIALLSNLVALFREVRQDVRPGMDTHDADAEWVKTRNECGA